MTTSLQISNITKTFGTITAVDKLDLKTHPGSVIALLGPNGAGKSTLMNMIAGYLKPSAGQIKVLGKDIESYPLEAKENIGFLSEGAPLYPDLTVARFLSYMAELRGFGGYVKADLLQKVAAQAKIENVMGQRIETLSKGYVRRVGFAQSIPPILLLDEPTDGLDPNQKVHIRQMIAEMGKDKTIVISTHLLEEAETVCNRIVMINKGRIVADGTLNAVLKKCKAASLEEAFRKLTSMQEEV